MSTVITTVLQLLRPPLNCMLRCSHGIRVDLAPAGMWQSGTAPNYSLLGQLVLLAVSWPGQLCWKHISW